MMSLFSHHNVSLAGSVGMHACMYTATGGETDNQNACMYTGTRDMWLRDRTTKKKDRQTEIYMMQKTG